ncbi:hypothetical protein BsWGS_27448 [Bradybaena similaris]
MPQVAYHPLRGLEQLEHGLKSLLRSRLMEIPAFRDMYAAIQRHYSDVKLAHLTGKAKDLQIKAVRDTKFFNILVNMLCEVAGRQVQDQREGLRQVHTWYLTNSHALFCGPHFGKQLKQEEAKEILRRATSAKQADHIKPSKEREWSQDNTCYHADTLSTDECLDLWGEPGSSTGPPADSDIDPGSLPLDEDLPFDDKPCARTATNSPQLGDGDNIDQLNSRAGAFTPSCHGTSTEGSGTLTPGCDGISNEGSGTPDDEPATISPPRVLMRPKTGTCVDFSLKKQSKSLPHAVADIRSVVHPVASLVNPHASVSKLLAPGDTGHLVRTATAGRRASSAKPSRSQSLQAWQTFNKKRSFGQDVASSLSFIGRSGTGLCLRYSAHEFGESPEAHMRDFWKLCTRHSRSSSKPEAGEGNVFVHQTLEDFYQAVENVQPTSSRSCKPPHISRAKSAPAADTARAPHQASVRGSKPVRSIPTAVIQPGPGPDDRCRQETVSTDSDTGVNLDSVISVIDAVTDSMAFYKEKLAPKPQLGFRQPSTMGLLPPRELVPSSTNDASIDSEYGLWADIHQLENMKVRPFSSSLDYDGTAAGREDMPEKHKKTQMRCASAGVLDWRGRIIPESVRYKWSKTHCGGHTYVKKFYQPQPRSAGCSVASRSGTGRSAAGRRPKTAPITSRDTWRRDAVGDRNVRAVQAASHRAAPVDHAQVQSRLQTQHLPSSESRSDPVADSLSIDGQTWRQLIRKSTELPVMKFLPFVAPSVTAEHQSEKCTSYRDKTEDKTHTGRASSVNFWEQDHNVDSNIHVPHHHFDEDALDAAVREELSSTSQSVQPSDSELHGRAGKTNDESLVSSGQPFVEFKAATMTTKVERSAGRMPGQAHSATVSSQSQRGANVKVPPVRSPASIPSPQVNFDRSKPRNAQLLFELERHARRTTSPADYLHKVEALRSSPYVQGQAARLVPTDPIVGTSLRISRLPASSRDPPRMTTSASQKSGWEPRLGTETPIPCTVPQHSGGPGTGSLVQPGPSAGSISRVGRPVAEPFQTPDPDDVLQAVQLRRQAAAAVDIQRIFRGYVTRSMYKSLLSEERHRREDGRRAAVKIQRMYRSHLLRKHAIYNRPPLDPEIIQWSKDVKELQSEHSAQRQAKLASWTKEVSFNHRETKQKLAVIGPHVEVYSACHPKRVGPTRHELNTAAVTIQKIIRGWLLRRRLEKLSRKAAGHGSSFQQLARDYKSMLRQVQRQHGVDKPKTPFSLKLFNDYMDLRRRYESIFVNKSFGGELDADSLPAFFRECGLYPSQAEIEQALDVTLQGHGSRKHDRGLTKRQVLDVIFYIYVPPAAGLEGTRHSTWMNPIVDGQEAGQLLGCPDVEATPLAPCMQLVIEAKEARRRREQSDHLQAERTRLVGTELRTEDKNTISDVEQVDAGRSIDEDKQTSRKSKKVTLQESENMYH